MEIKTNDRFDRLTNLDISTHYRDTEFWFFKGDFLSALSYWIIRQSPYDVPELSSPLNAFDGYLAFIFLDDKIPQKFTYQKVAEIINEDVFVEIPAIMELNKSRKQRSFPSTSFLKHPDYDFIDLGALARNVFYMILREYITQNLEVGK